MILHEILSNHNSVSTMAAALIEAGYHPVPIPAGRKGPKGSGASGWHEKEYRAADFRDGMNIGLRHTNVAAVDLDCPEVLGIAGRFLPATFTGGKESTPHSHWWYTPENGTPGYKKFTDTDNTTTILELRCGGGKQTVIPPSVHPSGESYRAGESGLDVEGWDASEMRLGAGMLATAGLIALHLPKHRDAGGGGRHEIALPLAGYMLRNGETPEDTLKILTAAWDAAGYAGGYRDQEDAHRDLEGAVKGTRERLDRGDPTTGGKKLAEWDEKLPRKIADFLGWESTRSEEDPADEGEEKGGRRESHAKQIVDLALRSADELFLDQNGAEYALVEGVPIPLDGGCYGWLRRLFWDHKGTPAANDALGTAAGQLRAFTEVSGNERALHLRATQYEGALYLYLGPGRVARVDAHGWEIDPEAPVMFRRVVNLKELPNPERGGSLDLLDEFITAREPRDHRLAKAWLVLALLADVDRPILLAHGPQGATKSSVQRVLKNTIDPARPESLKLRDKDFEQNLYKAFIPFFDNVSSISDHMADELSKAVTGAGNAVRKLYADDADVIREYKRAILLNGLVVPTEKADLIDRFLPVALRRIPPNERKTARRMQALFDERHPKLLGAVLDALSGTLSYHEEINGWLPRVADWAEFAIALYQHLGWGGYEGFKDDWAVIEEDQYATTLESSGLAQAAFRVAWEHAPEVEAKVPEMLKLLQRAAESEGLDPEKDKEFPSRANWLWRKLVPVIPTLESLGVEATSGRDESKARVIRLRYTTPTDPSGSDGTNRSANRTNMDHHDDSGKPHTYAPEPTEPTEPTEKPESRLSWEKGR